LAPGGEQRWFELPVYPVQPFAGRFHVDEILPLKAQALGLQN
jgi:hypothetical protein